MHRADSPATPVPHTPGLSPATQLPASDAAPPATVSPFADVAEAATGPLMEPSSLPPTPGVSASAQPAAAAPPARPVLQAAQSTQLQIPSTSRTTEPPGKIIPPRIVIPGEESEASSSRSQLEPASPQEPPTRWWTEWLCGCREEKTEQQVRCIARCRASGCVFTATCREAPRTRSSNDLFALARAATRTMRRRICGTISLYTPRVIHTYVQAIRAHRARRTYSSSSNATLYCSRRQPTSPIMVTA